MGSGFGRDREAGPGLPGPLVWIPWCWGAPADQVSGVRPEPLTSVAGWPQAGPLSKPLCHSLACGPGAFRIPRVHPAPRCRLAWKRQVTWMRPQCWLLLTAGAGKGPQSLPRANRTHLAGPAERGDSQARSLPWKDSGGDQHKGGRQDGGPRSLGGAVVLMGGKGPSGPACREERGPGRSPDVRWLKSWAPRRALSE